MLAEECVRVCVCAPVGTPCAQAPLYLRHVSHQLRSLIAAPTSAMRRPECVLSTAPPKRPSHLLTLVPHMSLWGRRVKVQQKPGGHSQHWCCFNSRGAAVKKEGFGKKRPHLFVLNSGRSDH